ncbi:hypothetical protein BJ170DRAFT_594180 [Xylariales sp. AK1849]|nr:hypothetical protein BJ170DRAFT_594180 [Xylariales sp. AK1849]
MVTGSGSVDEVKSYPKFFMSSESMWLSKGFENFHWPRLHQGSTSSSLSSALFESVFTTLPPEPTPSPSSLVPDTVPSPTVQPVPNTLSPVVVTKTLAPLPNSTSVSAPRTSSSVAVTETAVAPPSSTMSDAPTGNVSVVETWKVVLGILLPLFLVAAGVACFFWYRYRRHETKTRTDMEQMGTMMNDLQVNSQNLEAMNKSLQTGVDRVKKMETELKVKETNWAQRHASWDGDRWKNYSPASPGSLATGPFTHPTTPTPQPSLSSKVLAGSLPLSGGTPTGSLPPSALGLEHISRSRSASDSSKDSHASGAPYIIYAPPSTIAEESTGGPPSPFDTPYVRDQSPNISPCLQNPNGSSRIIDLSDLPPDLKRPDTSLSHMTALSPLRANPSHPDLVPEPLAVIKRNSTVHESSAGSFDKKIIRRSASNPAASQMSQPADAGHDRYYHENAHFPQSNAVRCTANDASVRPSPRRAPRLVSHEFPVPSTSPRWVGVPNANPLPHPQGIMTPLPNAVSHLRERLDDGNGKRDSVYSISSSIYSQDTYPSSRNISDAKRSSLSTRPRPLPIPSKIPRPCPSPTESPDRKGMPPPPRPVVKPKSTFKARPQQQQHSPTRIPTRPYASLHSCMQQRTNPRTLPPTYPSSDCLPSAESYVTMTAVDEDENKENTGMGIGVGDQLGREKLIREMDETMRYLDENDQLGI